MLNIYKISGIGAVRDYGRYRYWTANTYAPDNTVAFNYVLSQVNLMCAEADIVSDKRKKIDLLNKLDIYIICLEGLFLLDENRDKYNLDYIREVISGMVADGLFLADFTDDIKRSNNLDVLIADFESRLSDSENKGGDAEFDVWWKTYIEPFDYNNMSQSLKDRYKDIINSSKVGALGDFNSSDAESIEEYVSDAGPYFLYAFIPDKDINKYNAYIRYRRDIEVRKSRAWLDSKLDGFNNKYAIDTLLRIGVIAQYKCTPEEKLQEVYDYGGNYRHENISGNKTGVVWTVEAILMLVSIVLGFLMSLVTLIVQWYGTAVALPTGYEDGAPDGDTDLSAAWERDREEEEAAKLKKLLLIGGAAAMMLFLTK